MPNNNPTGSNAYGDNGTEEPYGAIERRKVLTAMAPAGNAAVASVLNAPRRNQRKATQKTKPIPNKIVHADQAQQVANQPPPQAQPDPMVTFWQSLAAEPGASPLVKQFAAEVGVGG